MRCCCGPGPMVLPPRCGRREVRCLPSGSWPAPARYPRPLTWGPRLAIRMGFTALREIGVALGISHDPDPDPNSEIVLTFAEFAAAVDQLQTVGFPMERTAAEAWPHFRGWRVNYEALAYELAWR